MAAFGDPFTNELNTRYVRIRNFCEQTIIEFDEDINDERIEEIFRKINKALELVKSEKEFQKKVEGFNEDPRIRVLAQLNLRGLLTAECIMNQLIGTLPATTMNRLIRALPEN